MDVGELLHDHLLSLLCWCFHMAQKHQGGSTVEAINFELTHTTAEKHSSVSILKRKEKPVFKF